ncbi:MAG: DUF1800 family protein [Saprospiraceae bacterium]|nr:DUF1800 family protein [Saprospiraceae bacterium]
MKCQVLFFCLLIISSVLSGQFRNYDFIGAGHDYEVTVTSSSESIPNSGKKTIDGFPVQNQDQLMDASRFLAQSTFGADMATIRMAAAMGYESWLEEQFSLPATYTTTELLAHGPLYGDLDEFEGNGFHTFHNFNTAWITNNLTSPDLLRQRVAYALSQIMVINNSTDFFHDVGIASSNYYDLLLKNAFGRFDNLLMDVTRSASMGTFLSHYGNPKADPANNIHPDENYAREIMQLFTIGLWELNPDGTRKYDTEGQFIPTYTNADIKEFAQVFTGLSDGGANGEFGPFDESEDRRAMVMEPMKMYDAFHDKSEKQLLNGTVLPAGQSGDEDLSQTIQHLSTHPNTAPFISKSLIKMLTTSNPSPAYVKRVADKFNPNEDGNHKELIKAILLDPEARNCNHSETYTFGKLREPVVRMMNYLRAFPMTANENGDYLYVFECLKSNTGQAPLQAPSVFNFYLPDYSPQGPISQQYKVAPEFQILNSTNVIGLINEVHKLTVNQEYLEDFCIVESFEEDEEPEEPDEEELLESFEMYSDYRMDYSEVSDLINNPDAMIDYLDILLANGLLTDQTKDIIKDAMYQLNEPTDKLRMATYLIMIAPDYAILK